MTIKGLEEGVVAKFVPVHKDIPTVERAILLVVSGPGDGFFAGLRGTSEKIHDTTLGGRGTILKLFGSCVGKW